MLKQILRSLLKWLISSEWGHKLPSIFHQMAGAAVPSVAGLVKKPIKRDKKKDFTYLVNHTFSQTIYHKDMIDAISGQRGVGLEGYIRRAMQRVKDAPQLMPNANIRAAFLAQKPKKTADESCMVIAPYIWFKMVGVRVPDPETYLIESINRGVISDDVTKRYIGRAKPAKTGNFVWLHGGSIALVRVWMPGAHEVQKVIYNSNFSNANQIIEAFKKTGIKIALIRKGRGGKYGTHTHLCGWFDGELLNFEQYHHSKTLQPVKDRYAPGKSEKLYYLYAYK